MPNESKIYGETSNGLVEFSKCHILIEIPKLDKLTFANRKSYPPNTSSKKIEEWNNLRANLKEFKNSYLTEVIS